MEVFFAVQTVLLRLGSQTIVKAVVAQDILVCEKQGAHKEHSKVTLAHPCILNVFALVSQHAKPPLGIRPIHEHQKDLQD